MTKEELIEKGLMPKKVDDYYLYKNGFEYEINGKKTLKLFDGTTLCKDVDCCYLFKDYFKYTKNNETFRKTLKEFVNKKVENNTIASKLEYIIGKINKIEEILNGKL